ncbi:MAG: hypothetical protein HKK66_04410 [Chlorobiaceae bacterium]|nr:hypothetical protein [Chlorobiaceae bacterium]
MIACWRFELRKYFKKLTISFPELLLSPFEDWVNYFNHDRFRGYNFRSLAFRPTISLSTLRSGRYRTPRKTRYMAAG